MNMLSKPVERCRKTSYSLNLSLVLSALNALYKLLEIFCCILSLKKHLQARRSSSASPSTRCSSAPRPIHGLDRGDLRGLVVDHQQRRVLRREQVVAERVTNHGCTHDP